MAEECLLRQPAAASRAAPRRGSLGPGLAVVASAVLLFFAGPKLRLAGFELGFLLFLPAADFEVTQEIGIVVGR